MFVGDIIDTVHLVTFMTVFVMTLFAGIMVVMSRDVIRAGVSLFICLSGVAGIYFFLDAQFLAVVQIMVYVGGTTVLILFGVMLTNRAPVLTARRHVDRTLAGWVASAAVAGPLLAVLVLRPTVNVAGEVMDAKKANGWYTMRDNVGAAANMSTQGLGEALLTNYILPFEIASIVLLVALVGSAYLARRRQDEIGIAGRVT